MYLVFTLMANFLLFHSGVDSDWIIIEDRIFGKVSSE